MLRRRIPDSRLDALIERRGRALRSLVEPEVLASLAALREAGVIVEVVGSFAQGRFRSTSDVDFLVLDPGRVSEGKVHDLLAGHLRSAPFDLIFADRLPPGSADLMLAHARAAAP
jgi:predicted nucleotidyltransferase